MVAPARIVAKVASFARRVTFDFIRIMALQKASASLAAVVARIVPNCADEFFQRLSSESLPQTEDNVKYFDNARVLGCKVPAQRFASRTHEIVCNNEPSRR